MLTCVTVESFPDNFLRFFKENNYTACKYWLLKTYASDFTCLIESAMLNFGSGHRLKCLSRPININEEVGTESKGEIGGKCSKLGNAFPV